MKTIREYHIEYYWQEQAYKKKKRAEMKEDIEMWIVLTLFTIFSGITIWSVLDLILK